MPRSEQIASHDPNQKKPHKKNFSSKLESLINQMNDRIQNFNNENENIE